MKTQLRGLAALCLVVLIAACTQVYTQPPAAPPAGPSSASGSSPGARPDSDDSPFDEWDEALEDTEEREGFFDLHVKRDNTLFLEIDSARLGEEFGMVLHFSKGVGVFGAHDGLPVTDTRLMRFIREGDKIYLVHVNDRFTADAGSPMMTSLQDNVGHSIVADFDIESEHEETGALLIDATGFFVSDYGGLTLGLRPAYRDRPVRIDTDRSWVDSVMAFPNNVEIDALITVAATDPPASSTQAAGVSDFRSVPLGIRYSLFALPEDPMQRRYADDRVGHFIDAQRDFSRDREKSPYVRYVERWRLEKRDNGAEISEPVDPIVFYIDRSVPVRYHRWVREGIEGWNKAFEAAGFRNAIVARLAPTVEEDPTWSAEDIRYSTVRWSAAHSMGFAIGPSQSDPRTGELLNADILISSIFINGYFRDWEELAGDEESVLAQLERAEEVGREMAPELARRMCVFELGKTHQLQFQHAALTALGVIDGTEPMPDEFLGPSLRELVLHEVGHTLGLRHNFKASAAIPYGRLNDTEYTRENGVSLSVMEYNAVNINPDRTRQGHYVNEEVGAYDVWAIRYAYQPVYQQALSDNGVSTTGTPVSSPDDELPALMRIAGESAEPLHAYGTDEDVGLGAWGVDPLSNRWDLSSDPFAWASERARLVAMVGPALEDRIVDDGEGYSRLRGAFQSVLAERLNSLQTIARLVGGVHHARDHRGQPGARAPFTPVPADEQRRAVAFLIDNAFDEDAWDFESDLLNKLPPNRFADWNTGFAASGAVDFPVHQWVLTTQRNLLANLLNTAKMARIIDNELRMPGGDDAYRLDELFGTLTASVFGEFDAPARNANSLRRNLQRDLLDRYVGVLMGERPSTPYPTPPEDARSLARYELDRLAERMRTALTSGSLDTVNTAHLEESVARIERALAASLSVEAS